MIELTKKIEILKQDLEAIIKAFKDDQYVLSNIFSNRLMANAIFQENYKLFLPGLFLKEISFNFEKLRQNPNFPIETSKAKINGYIDFFFGNFNENLNEEDFWRNYFNCFSTIWKLQKDKIEESVYQENVEFTEDSFKKLLGFLNKHKLILLDRRNNLLGGIINEMNRILRNHNSKLKEFQIYSYLIALERL